MKEEEFDLIIAGGGMGGMVCAISFAQLGFKIALIERSDIPNLTSKNYDGRNTALNKASIRMLKTVGIWDHAIEYMQPIHDILVSDGTVRKGASSLFLHFDYLDIGDEPLGYFIQNPDLREALLKTAKQHHNIHCFYNQSVQKISYHSDNAVTVETDKSRFSAPLLIGADGRGSVIRTLSDIDVTRKDYDQKGIVTTIHHELPHEGIAQEFFLPSGPFAMLPLTGNRTSLVWTEKTEIADALVTMEKDVFLYEVKRRFGNHLGKISQSGPILTYPLSFLKADTLIAKRMSLIGDSAHGIHPISGQGFNLGLRDTAVLYDIIKEQYACGLDIGCDIALTKYNHLRQNDITMLSAITDGLNMIFSNENKIISTGRRICLDIAQNSPYMKQYFMKHATSDIGDLPTLMQ